MVWQRADLHLRLLTNIPPAPYHPLSPLHRIFTHKPTHVCTLFFGGNGALLPYEQIAAPMPSERSYGGIWEKSIEYPKKVYRVFSDRIGATLRSLPSSTPLPSYKRSVTSHPLLRYVGRNICEGTRGWRGSCVGDG